MPRIVMALDDKLQAAQKAYDAFAESRLSAGTVASARTAENPGCMFVGVIRNPEAYAIQSL